MKFFIGIDIETSGLEWRDKGNLILEFGFMVGFLYRPEVWGGTYLIPHSFVSGERRAIVMAAKNGLLERMEKGEGAGHKTENIAYWFKKEVENVTGVSLTFPQKKIPLLGKNLGKLDLPFLESRCKDWLDLRFDHRILDPGMLYLLASDSVVPGLKTCSERAGINTSVAHTAKEDVFQTIRLVHEHFGVEDTKEVSQDIMKRIFEDGNN